ncbi:carboxylesterase family protein [Corallococcus sp. CA053C]|uniref:carboxylesterase/lipase family protein n=1 Tax=Corallococcus sp. CA053C TaxID=2316732 RepID=UPI000EA0B2C6|nr:carboxylesterase family protein [Corallococcus sp. CA053C]RKH06431.1 carboxylesterase family protein [Corallococcus sp. CA053C]
MPHPSARLLWLLSVTLLGGCMEAPVSPSANPVDVGVTTAALDVTTDDGPVRGVSTGGLNIFKGIPYAEPPTGNRRWAPPARPSRWTQPRPATDFGPPCPQVKDGAVYASEDCLRLNVWAPAAPAKPRAVLVWIHGGGYVEGHSSEGWYDAAQLAQREDLVVVSFNYRLGLLGFLALPQLIAPDGGTGNWGLRDQIAALDWVRRNIAAFGGDPQRVMIAGESAGAVSVTTLLAATPAQGLFQRAAIQSGTSRPVLEKEQPVGAFPSAYFVGLQTAIVLGCTEGDIAACLRSKSAVEVLGTQARLTPVTELGLALTPTLPVVDGVVLQGRPLARVLAGLGDVPVLVGANDNEASFVLASIGVVGNPGDFGRYVDYVGAGAKKAELTALYRPAVVGEVAAADALGTDLSFACPAQRLATASATVGTARAYLYRFARALPNGPFASLGVAHGTDLVYLFGHFDAVGSVPTPQDLTLSQQLQSAWGAMARNGAPIPAWLPFSPGGTFITWNTPATTEVTWRAGRCASLEAWGLLPP